jgi:hypothetical protein
MGGREDGPFFFDRSKILRIFAAEITLSSTIRSPGLVRKTDKYTQGKVLPAIAPPLAAIARANFLK